MSATLGAALKKIAVALLTDRRNWEKLAVALFAVLLLFLLPILSVEAIFQADMDWDSPELVSAVLEELDVGSLGFLETSNNILTQLQTDDFVQNWWGVSLLTKPMRNWLST